MVTHGSTYQLLRNLNALDESTLCLDRDDYLTLIREDLKSHIKKTHEVNTRQYNLRTKPANFKVGQEVFRRNFAQNNFSKNFNAKLGPFFIKSRIREKVGSSMYILENLQGKLVGTYSAKDIRV